VVTTTDKHAEQLAVTATEDLVNELAGRADWRRAVEGLALSQRDAHELRVLILRQRVFHATAVGVANARRRRARVR
jgi:hypothetical protein